MVKLSVEEVTYIHNLVVKQFGISSGIINNSVLDAIVKRPDLKFGGEKDLYDDVFSKAAALLEGLIRWHPFADGNKRTALLATVFYLKLEGYAIALPLSAVRYTVKIAKNEGIDDKTTKKLIREISIWLKNHSGRTKRELSGKLYIYLVIPYKLLTFLHRIGFKKYVEKKVDGWLALDIYPEYEKEIEDIVKFIEATMESSFKVFDE